MGAKSFVPCGRLKVVPGERTYIMGILNVTPDSFSDGGLYDTPKQAIDYAQQMLDDGADILDIGGVSTAPNASPVSLDEELRRVLPVISGLTKLGINNLSVDTSRAEVAKQALDLGASWINDQHCGLFDPEMPKWLSQAQACVLMHNRGLSGVSFGESISYNNVVQDLCDFFAARLESLARFGVNKEKIIVDPGIGFGKGLADSLTLITSMRAFGDLGALTLLGPSRKSFLGPLTGIEQPTKRDFASLGAIAAGVMSGAHIIRTHNIRAAHEMLRVLDACIANGVKKA